MGIFETLQVAAFSSIRTRLSIPLTPMFMQIFQTLQVTTASDPLGRLGEDTELDPSLALETVGLDYSPDKLTGQI